MAIPAHAELPNLRKVVESAGVPLAEPLVVRGDPRVRRLIVGAALVALLAFGFIVVLDRLQFRTGDYHRLLHITFVGAAGVLAAWASWWRHLWRLPLRIDEHGVRFGFGPAIPWSEVEAIEWIGPSAAFPKEKAGLIWSLHGRPGIRIDFDAIRTPPERIALALRAFRASLT